MNTYKTGEFAKLVARSTRTVQRWTKNGTLPDRRTQSDKRYFTDEDLRTILGTVEKPRRVVVYCRVSSPGQKDDLKSQVKAMKKFCKENKLPLDDLVEEVGGGMNFKRKKFTALVDAIIRGEVSHLVIAHKDRLARFGYDLIVHLAKTHGTEIVVANQESLSPQEEMVEDMLAIVHTFSCRIYGMRRYSKKKKDEPKEVKTDDKSIQDSIESILGTGEAV